MVKNDLTVNVLHKNPECLQKNINALRRRPDPSTKTLLKAESGRPSRQQRPSFIRKF